jgi:hypothetical protein
MTHDTAASDLIDVFAEIEGEMDKLIASIQASHDGYKGQAFYMAAGSGDKPKATTPTTMRTPVKIAKAGDKAPMADTIDEDTSIRVIVEGDVGQESIRLGPGRKMEMVSSGAKLSIKLPSPVTAKGLKIYHNNDTTEIVLKKAVGEGKRE